jgi:hypothetical protein
MSSLIIDYLLFLKIIKCRIKAIVKNIAPPKHGVKKGLTPIAHPIVHTELLIQAIYSLEKLNQANSVPANKTKN